jgi:hypothetical protein
VNSIITLRDPQRWRISYLVVQFSTTEEHWLNVACYLHSHVTKGYTEPHSNLDGFYGTTKATESECEIYNIRKDPTETEWEVVDWIYLTHDRDHWQALVNTVMNLRVPQKTGIN